MTYLYTLSDCGACEGLRQKLIEHGKPFRVVPIDNPLLEIGVKLLFKDKLLHAPLFCDPEDGVFMPSNGSDQLLRILDLRNQHETTR